jgi:hypothetical protein
MAWVHTSGKDGLRWRVTLCFSVACLPAREHPQAHPHCPASLPSAPRHLSAAQRRGEQVRTAPLRRDPDRPCARGLVPTSRSCRGACRRGSRARLGRAASAARARCARPLGIRGFSSTRSTRAQWDGAMESPTTSEYHGSSPRRALVNEGRIQAVRLKIRHPPHARDGLADARLVGHAPGRVHKQRSALPLTAAGGRQTVRAPWPRSRDPKGSNSPSAAGWTGAPWNGW